MSSGDTYETVEDLALHLQRAHLLALGAAVVEATFRWAHGSDWCPVCAAAVSPAHEDAPRREG